MKTVFQDVFWTVIAAIIVFLPKALLSANAQMPMVFIQIVLSTQGKGRCPDVAYAGPFVTMKARSRLDCARMCASREGWLHHAFYKNNASCYHYYSTPAKLTTAEDCNFMVASSFTSNLVYSRPIHFWNITHHRCKIRFLRFLSRLKKRVFQRFLFLECFLV